MKSILIVDGDHYVADVFADLFALEEWEVTTYYDGLLAEDTLGGRAHYDAVLLSNRLSGMSGVELIKRTRALAHRGDVPIVMATGTGELDVVAAALAAGADEVLHKPVDFAVLTATVTKCVAKAHADARLNHDLSTGVDNYEATPSSQAPPLW
jgi:DNA-binding response OmpR family regulator